ncbi:MAG: Leucine-tRNA ligase [Candidatus Magasanikbacteria bacterium GW2011_GWC2_37_14]|uniref:Leucine--tRNA ligase n=1 Tax=Candidatus Magasanikbacteria bacterium GW2011_GWC2_37_14 TaxID=1619046 RepID=A0A0G0GAX0_9BACT|nr:MAG: Leucine-tRNA ligase [Candidatus Magasanikbacteria bacterium GW2011_GWC2_37_14]
MNKYAPNEIEPKWQKYWEDNKLFEVTEDPSVKTQGREKFYGLIEFPYPSGAGLHVGHPRPFTAMDVICRKKRMEGKNVLFPIGFDAFGLPTENFAIKTGRQPAEVTAENISNFTRQLKMLGYSFAWDRVVDTTDPKYYKWTQWIFLQLFKHGLAYKKAMPINWCPSCKIGLANEEVVDGKCERCGTVAEKRNKEQWMLAITKYADKLLQGLENVDYIPQAKIQQQNWIGRSEGINFKHRVKDMNLEFEVYDSIPQTFLAQTFVIIAPEHPYVYEMVRGTEHEKKVMEFVEKIKKKKAGDKFDIDSDMEGIFTGRYSENYLGIGRDLPIWVASFALMDYGTGIVGCSVHDERDYKFAKMYNLPLHPVLFPKNKELAEKVRGTEIFYREPDGVLEEPIDFKGRKWNEVRQDVIEYIVNNNLGKRAVNYKLRDWVFSRQRYWGEPIPLVYCENCKNKKYHYVLVHGYYDPTNFAWLMWAKNELEKQGHTVDALDLPNYKTPNVNEQVDFLLDKVKIDENIVLVGHSMGGAVVMKLLEKINKKVAKVVFVDCFIRPEFVDRPRPDVEKSCDWKFDFKKLKKLSDEFIILADSSYGVINKGQDREMADLFNGKLIIANPIETHFRAKEEPEVLKQLENNGWISLPESELPLELPKVEKYEPTDTGESPLAHITDWINVACPACGSPARRETDTMPNWAGSSWYFLAYTMMKEKNGEYVWDRKKMDYWNPVNWYNGGMEHTVLHLLYSRFWNQFLYDIGVVPTSEPYKKRTSHGMILAADGEKMSKSRGNVINPDEMVEKFGTDAFRTYIMFMGPFDQAVAWDTNGVVGVRRFLEKVWTLQERVIASGAKQSQGIATSADANRLPRNDKLTTLLHQTIKKVTEDIEAMRFNTAISQLMILVNEMSKLEVLSLKSYGLCLQLLSPFAPHLCEEIWNKLGNKESISKSEWPKYDPELAKSDTFTLAIQINGKLRDTLELPADILEEEVIKQALELEKIKKWLEDKEPKKIIYIKGKLLSIVI